MKLINVDDLIEQMEKDFSGKFLNDKGFCLIDNMSFMDCFKETLETIPTAYDVDEVIKQLEAMRKCEDEGFCNHCQYTWCPVELLDADEVIKVVRNCGV